MLCTKLSPHQPGNLVNQTFVKRKKESLQVSHCIAIAPGSRILALRVLRWPDGRCMTPTEYGFWLQRTVLGCRPYGLLRGSSQLKVRLFSDVILAVPNAPTISRRESRHCLDITLLRPYRLSISNLRVRERERGKDRRKN